MYKTALREKTLPARTTKLHKLPLEPSVIQHFGTYSPRTKPIAAKIRTTSVHVLGMCYSIKLYTDALVTTNSRNPYLLGQQNNQSAKPITVSAYSWIYTPPIEHF